MDRNGKKAKTPQRDASENTERSDTKASARDAVGRPGAQDGKGRGNAADEPAKPARKGQRA
jgi:hypothetical protein